MLLLFHLFLTHYCFSALMVGIIATVLMQSSSTTTTVIVSLTEARAISVAQGIYM